MIGADANDDPGLADPANLDFQLTENSPLINAGADLGILLDMAGNSRDALPDIGAFEFPLETPNVLPIADADGPYAVDEASNVTLDASLSFDPDGTIVSYEWDLNNDTFYDSTGITASFSTNQHGTHAVRLRVTDDVGASTTATATVNVANVPPPRQTPGSTIRVPKGVISNWMDRARPIRPTISSSMNGTSIMMVSTTMHPVCR